MDLDLVGLGEIFEVDVLQSLILVVFEQKRLTAFLFERLTTD